MLKLCIKITHLLQLTKLLYICLKIQMKIQLNLEKEEGEYHK